MKNQVNRKQVDQSIDHSKWCHFETTALLNQISNLSGLNDAKYDISSDVVIKAEKIVATIDGYRPEKPKILYFLGLTYRRAKQFATAHNYFTTAINCTIETTKTT